MKMTRGFTLLELTVVLVILGVLATGGLVAGAGMVEQAAKSDSEEIVKLAEKSLKDFYTVNGRLPCVARMNANPGTALFGAELDCTAAAVAGESWRSGGVRIGMLPVRTLGLSDTTAADKYNSRLLYVVTEALTNAAGFGGSNGAIIIQDANNNNVTSAAAYAVISPGKDRKGGRVYKTGATPTACSAGTLDSTNCDMDATFRDAPFNDGSVPASFFDDIIRWVPAFHLRASESESANVWAAGGDASVYSVGTDSNTTNTNVGIGTNAPQWKLDVGGAGNAGVYSRLGGMAIVTADSGHEWWTGSYTSAGPWQLTRRKVSDGTATSSLTMTPGGAMGVGTDSPGYRLHVSGDVYADGGWFRVGGDKGIIFENYGGGWFMQDATWIRSYGSKPVYMESGMDTGSPVGIGCGGGLGGGSMFRVCGTGWIGIWPSSAAIALHTAGSADFDGHIYVGGAGYSYGGWGYMSDRRLKKNIQTISFSGLELVAKLRPVTFEWKNPGLGGEGEKLGFIAQEVEELLPQVVKEAPDSINSLPEMPDDTKDKGPMKTVDETSMIPVLVKAIQELKAENEELRGRLGALEANESEPQKIDKK